MLGRSARSDEPSMHEAASTPIQNGMLCLVAGRSGAICCIPAKGGLGFRVECRLPSATVSRRLGSACALFSARPGRFGVPQCRFPRSAPVWSARRTRISWPSLAGGGSADFVRDTSIKFRKLPLRARRSLPCGARRNCATHCANSFGRLKLERWAYNLDWPQQVGGNCFTQSEN